MTVGRQSSLIRQVCRLRFVPRSGDLPDTELLERFVNERDQAAFELMTWRHSAMVLGVCRRLLRHEQDAEDAFQATFLTFACKASSIGKRESLGSWLYKVAYRTSLKARAASAARVTREKRPGDASSADPGEEAAWRELLPILDAEINGLPDRYRIPFVLHCLEGKTLNEISRQLGRPLATVSTRVRRARQRLSSRLCHRGLAPTAAVFAYWTRAAVGASVPETLMDSTWRAAAQAVTGQSLSGLVPANVVALTCTPLGRVGMKKLLAVMSAVVGVAVVGGLAHHTLASGRPGVGDGRPDKPPGVSPPDRVTTQAARALSLLDEALKAAPAIPDPTERVWVLCEIARAQARVGQRDGATATIRQAIAAAKGIDDEVIRDHRLKDVTECQADTGDIEGAVETAGFIRRPDTSDHALTDIAAAQARVGKVTAALETAARIRGNEFRKGEALHRIAATQAERRDFKAALETASSIPDRREKPSALAAIALEQARAGDRVTATALFDKALRLANDLPSGRSDDTRDTVLAVIARAQAEAGLLEDAQRTAGSITTPRCQGQAWRSVVASQSGRGDPRSALRTADLIKDEYIRGEAVVAVVAALARAKDVAKAREAMATISNEMWRVYALLELAVAQSEAGRRDDAVRTLQEALRLAGQLRENQPLGNVKPYALANVAKALGKIGEEKAVLAWLEQQSSPLVKARALIRLAEGVAESQQTDRPGR